MPDRAEPLGLNRRRIAVLLALLLLTLLVVASLFVARFAPLREATVPGATYALIVWRGPVGLADDTVAARIQRRIEERGIQEPLIRFTPGLALYPSISTGVGLPEIREVVQSVIQATPGLEAMVILPPSGSSVVAWMDPQRGTFPAARAIMNEPGQSTFPQIQPFRPIPLMTDEPNP